MKVSQGRIARIASVMSPGLDPRVLWIPARLGHAALHCVVDEAAPDPALARIAHDRGGQARAHAAQLRRVGEAARHAPIARRSHSRPARAPPSGRRRRRPRGSRRGSCPCRRPETRRRCSTGRSRGARLRRGRRRTGCPWRRARGPPLHAIASCAEHSALLVGFESGITSGRSTWRAISSIIACRNVPGVAVAPTSTVGFSRRITSSGVGDRERVEPVVRRAPSRGAASARLWGSSISPHSRSKPRLSNTSRDARIFSRGAPPRASRARAAARCPCRLRPRP